VQKVILELCSNGDKYGNISFTQQTCYFISYKVLKLNKIYVNISLSKLEIPFYPKAEGVIIEN